MNGISELAPPIVSKVEKKVLKLLKRYIIFRDFSNSAKSYKKRLKYLKLIL